ncbi:hypothetical protein OS242_05670 [Tumebacillus sp. DT12]|uniref:Uncharacterized protein n=1 Tax=Tumebacillus lacus TaxID=2995335 RepID=A0ABT3X0B0_9BACL|nr:hypothetical protein [Tumebacillus lacus]MCX7569442.1 hypothetical protein [Tumebacillus lacus]
MENLRIKAVDGILVGVFKYSEMDENTAIKYSVQKDGGFLMLGSPKIYEELFGKFLVNPLLLNHLKANQKRRAMSVLSLIEKPTISTKP